MNIHKIAHSRWTGWLPLMGVIRALFGRIGKLDSQLIDADYRLHLAHQKIHALHKEILGSLNKANAIPLLDSLSGMEMSITEVFDDRTKLPGTSLMVKVTTPSRSYPRLHRELVQVTEGMLTQLAREYTQVVLKQMENIFYRIVREEDQGSWK